jgi:tetratricopeptide (TPR) repeat protein
MLPRENQLESDKLTEFCSFPAVLLSLFFLAALVLALPLRAQEQPPNWQAQVRKYSEASDWTAALRVIDAEIARAPQDLDLKAWRARVLTWAGRPEEAEHAYREILSVEGPSHNDPDHWAGLATACLRQGKIEEARGSIETAVKIDPKRADLHVAYANILRTAGQPTKAQAELDKARSLYPTGTKAPQPIKTGRTHLNEFRGGVETDSLSYTVPNQGQSASLNTQWSPLWSTNLGGAFYQRSGIFAAKFVGSVTFRAPSLAAITAGGAIADDMPSSPRVKPFLTSIAVWPAVKPNSSKGSNSNTASTGIGIRPHAS